MRRIPFFLVAVAMLLALANISSAQDRTFGARRFLLDDGTNTPAGLVYMTDNNGSLGVDNSGTVTGTFPSTCAIMDLSSISKGFLPPRMTGAQEAAICGGTPPFGLLVYNTSSNTLDLYSPSGWAPILGGMSWLLGGNLILPGGGGLGPGQSFIGTNDAADFVIATGGTERARVIGVAGPNVGWVGIATVAPTALLDVNGTFNSVLNSTVGTASGTNNTMGNGGGGSNTIGSGGGGTTNSLGDNATFNSVGNSASANQFGNFSTQNEYGTFAGTNYFGYGATQNNIGNFGGETNFLGASGASTNWIRGTTNINVTTSDPTSIGSITNGSPVVIASTNATAITLNVANVANNLRLANIQAGSNADAVFLDLTAATTGNVRTRTIGSLITTSNGVNAVYTGSSVDVQLANAAGLAIYSSDRFLNTAGFTTHFDNAAVDYATLSSASIGLNNNAANAGITSIGNTTAGGAVTIRSSVSTATTSPTNTITATGAAGNAITSTTDGNAITAQTNNTVIATTGANSVTAQTSNTLTANTGNNNLNATALNALTGGTGNTVTATTGNNVLTTNGNGQNNLNSNGLGGQNNLNANSATGQNNITANVAGGSNNIVGATNINNNQNFNTQISTGSSTGTTTIGNANAGAISLQSNAGTAITLNVTNTANNLQLGNIAVGSNADAAFLDMTAIATGNVRTRTINSMITGTQGVEVTYTGSSADAHFAAASGHAVFGSARYINTGANILHITNSGAADYLTFNGNTNQVDINTATVASTNIGNAGGASTTTIGSGATLNLYGSSAAFNDIGHFATQNGVGTSSSLNFFGQLATTNNFGTLATTNNMGTSGTSTNNIQGTTNINVTGGATTNIATTNAATTNIGTAANATNNIGNGGGATTNTIGNSANLNTFGTSATTNNIGQGAGLNQVGNSAATNQFGASAGTNQYGSAAGTNQFGFNSASNTFGTAGVSTNAINGTLNINTASNQLTTNGNGATGMHLLVNGLVDASLIDAAGNGHWDFQVNGDAYVTGRTRLFGDILGSSQLTVTAGTTLNGGAVVNLGLQVFNGTTLNNGTTLLNLPNNADDWMLTTPVVGGGVVSTRQVSTLPFVGGQIPFTAQALGIAYAVAAADYLVICTNAGAGNVTLPAAAGAAGKVYVVKRTNGAVTVAAAAGAIDGAANFVLGAANQVAAFASDGANWWVVSN
ncbi:MAG: hypothetical protein ABI778_01640 [Ignavibacteriota bacterium]